MNASNETLNTEKLEKKYEKIRKKFKLEDFNDIIDKSDELEEKIKNNGPLFKLFDQIKLLISLVKDYTNGNYREIPLNSMLAVGAALLYVLSPIDLIPDFIPFVGYVDDAAVVLLCLKLVQADLDNYEIWKNNQTK